MELNLDLLFQTGNAFKNFAKKDDQLIKVKDKKVTELKDDNEEGVITTKGKEEETEETLEEKLENIEKVIETFSGKDTTVINSSQSIGQSSPVNLNQVPLDLGTAQAKAYQAEYLKPSTVHDDRIALLYDNLKKYNLI